jgi:hypothetical protein
VRFFGSDALWINRIIVDKAHVFCIFKDTEAFLMQFKERGLFKPKVTMSAIERWEVDKRYFKPLFSEVIVLKILTGDVLAD